MVSPQMFPILFAHQADRFSKISQIIPSAMSPHAEMPPSPASSDSEEEVYDLNVPIKSPKACKTPCKYSAYLPTWDPVFFPPLPEFPFTDPALRADPQKRFLLDQPGVTTAPISPKMGTEVHGLQLSALTPQQLDDLALLVSERKCVVFRDQDFADTGPARQQSFADHFGKANYQPASGSIPDYPGFHIIYRDGNQSEIDRYFSQKSSASIWHHDVSYERQPPGYVVLCMLQCPDVGGDTVVASMTEAYKRLSPGFRGMLDTLKATHSSERLCAFAKSNGALCRKDAVKTLHPLVRVHPVTGEKSLFVNEEWITGIQGWKQSETEWLIKYLMDHISRGHDFQVRLTWKPRSVVVFDNRSTIREYFWLGGRDVG